MKFLVFISILQVISANFQLNQQKFPCFRKLDGNYRDPENCSKFYMCSNYITYSMNCVYGTHYHPESDSCIYHKQANCVLNPCEFRQNGNYKDPNNCDKYITCVWGRAYSMNCYYGLFYDENRDKCVYQSEVECQ